MKLRPLLIAAIILGVLTAVIFSSCENPFIEKILGPRDDAFVPVTNITGVQEDGIEGQAIILSGTVIPYSATNKTILWSYEGDEEAVCLEENSLTVTTAKTITVKATIKNGKTPSTDYTQEFKIEIISSGEGTSENPFKVYDVVTLKKVGTGEDEWYLNVHYKQIENIDMIDVIDFEPIGKNSDNSFTGSYNGGGLTISNLTINSDQYYQGLFGYVDSDGKVENVHLVDCYITGTQDYVGGVVGYNDGTVENCYVTGGSVSGSGNVGGVAGYNSFYSTVKNSYATGSVSGYSNVGGVVGYNSGTVENSHATGSVSGDSSGTSVGGVVGQNVGTVKNCYATGDDVSGGTSVGGVVGYNNAGTVENSYATGDVSGDLAVGGVVGQNNGASATVKNSYATGNVSGSGNVGGAVGYNSGGTVENCYATGDVSGGSAVGGVVGQNYGASATVENCVALNDSITGTDTTYLGRVAGSNGGGSLSNNYAKKTMDIGIDSIGAVSGANEPHGENVSTTAPNGGYNDQSFWADTMGWDFDDTWEMGGNDLPKLQNVPGQ